NDLSLFHIVSLQLPYCFLTKGSSHQAAVLALWLLLLPISQLLRAHRAKTIELINFDVVGSRGLCYERRRSRHLLLTLLSFECLLVGVVLLLSPNEDLVLLRCGKHVIQFSVVLNSRHPALGELTYRLLLLGR